MHRGPLSLALASLAGFVLALLAVSASHTPTDAFDEDATVRSESGDVQASTRGLRQAGAAQRTSQPEVLAFALATGAPASAQAAAPRALRQSASALELELAASIEAVHALGDTHDPRAVEQIANASLDPRSEVRVAAAETLVAIGGNDAALALGNLLLDEDPSVRREAVHGLAQVGSITAVEMLQHALADRDPLIREAAAEYLEELAHLR